jgi:hypothetical protein
MLVMLTGNTSESFKLEQSANTKASMDVKALEI